uniref:Capsid protein n=1 Tax=Lily symptomless virus TaxID=12173 RepID=Q70DZ3_LSV|nr:coat protein [Lily symptomless virus]
MQSRPDQESGSASETPARGRPTPSDAPRDEPTNYNNNAESLLEQRLTRLIEKLNAEKHNSNLRNVAFEIGRPSLEPTSAMRRNPANPYGRFSIDELFKMKVGVVSNNMATTEQMAKIASDIAGLGVPTGARRISNIANGHHVCLREPVQRSLTLKGSIEFENGAVPVDSIAAIMKKHAGLRKVCRLYAPIVWNSMLVRNQPPADWQAMGFQYNTRFAAFDTFDYVTNQAAIQPVEGIIRRPTSAEVIAHNAHKQLALDRSNRNERLGSLETEYTGGVQGAEIVRNHRYANNG